MARWYGFKIINGLMTIDEVPSYWRLKTQEWLDNYYMKGK